MNSLSSKHCSLNVHISVMLKFLLISLTGLPDMKLTHNFHLVKPYSYHRTRITGSLTEKLRVQGMDYILYSPVSSIHTISIDFISFPACQSLLAFILFFMTSRFYKILWWRHLIIYCLISTPFFLLDDFCPSFISVADTKCSEKKKTTYRRKKFILKYLTISIYIPPL